MEDWEGVLQTSSSAQDVRFYGKALKTAERLLKEDLAPFEIEWITETLLFKPVSLLETISSRRRDEPWWKTIADGFKVLAELVSGHWSYVDNHYEDIMRLCLLSYDAQTRKQAIHCMMCMLKRAPTVCGDVTRHINALEEATTCKAFLALLVGTICEYHDEEVRDEVQRIWRIYLNMLGSNKNTVSILSAVLQGIQGLFSKCGDELPVDQLNMFYEGLSEYLRTPRCEQVVLSILKHHGHLFKERLAADKPLRDYTWNIITQKTDKDAASALRSVYDTIFTVMDQSHIESTITTEIVPRTESPRTLVKYTALRVASCARARRVWSAAHARDAQCLEFHMRAGDVSYEHAEAISWCIESNMSNSDRLLQAAILFSDNLPPAKRGDILINGILNAPDDVRKTAVSFLLSQSVVDAASVDKYLSLWRDLLTDAALDRSARLFEDAVCWLIDCYTDIIHDTNEAPSNLSSLLYLTSHILSLHSAFAVQAACAALLPLVLAASGTSVTSVPSASVTSALLAVIRASVQHLPTCYVRLDDIINIAHCVDEASLWETCQILVLASDNIARTEDILQALQIVFSRNDVEPKLLSQALIKFDNLLKEMDNMDNQQVIDIINKIRKLGARKDMRSKDARILHRQVIVFLGKYGNDEYIEDHTEDTSVLKMKDLLVFNLPDTYEGVKLNLQGIFELAVTYEQPDALRALLTVILNNYDVVVGRAGAHAAHVVLVRALHALCRAERSARDARTARAARQAVVLCRSVPAVLALTACISREVSPTVRGMLCSNLEELLAPGAATESLLAAVAERTATMISEHGPTIRAGLDITQSLITALKGNNDLTQEYLPKILTITTKIHTNQSYTVFKLAIEAFTEDLGLFSADALDKTVAELTKNVLTTKITNLNAYKMILTANFTFLQTVYDFDRVLQLVLDHFDSTVNCLLVFVALKQIFQFDLDVCRKILGYNDCVVMNYLFGVKLDDDLTTWDAVCNFLKEYSVILLELQYQKTLQYIADLILIMKPETLIQINKTLSVCLNTYKTVLNKLPATLNTAFEDWYRRLNIPVINIKKILYNPEEAVKIKSLKIYNDIFQIPLNETNKWTPTMLQLFKINYFRGLQLKSVVLSDILSVSEKLLTQSDIKSMFFSDKTGLELCKTFVNVYYDKLVEKPFLLLDVDGDGCLLLTDVVECCLKRKCPADSCQNVVELVDELWPKFEMKSSITMKQSVVKHLLGFPGVGAQCSAVRWAVGVVGGAGGAGGGAGGAVGGEGNALDKIRLIGLLRAGEQFSACYRSYASCLPTRLSEMVGECGAMLRGLLDALAATGDATLFDILVTLAAGDDTKGWWDEAIDSCMGALALTASRDLYQAAYTRCWHASTLGVCDRVLVPLLRYSSSRFCEEFLSSIIADVFSILRRVHRDPTASAAYHSTLVTHTRALNILQVVFEKVAPESLESASSLINSGLGVAKPWACVSEACKLCLALRERASCPGTASHDLRQSHRLLHCAIYNCLTAAICRRRPDEKFYKYIFDVHAWANIVDNHAVYQLPLQPTWRRRSTQRRAVSIDVMAGAASTAASAASTAATLRTRLYLRTLSENPLQYDMIQQDDDDSPSVNQELQLSDSELNAHECSGTLAALLAHAAALDHAQWTATLSGALVGGMHNNVKWLLAQAVCNAEAELRPRSATLTPALLRLVADTADVTGDVALLNGIHIDVITTIINWNECAEITDTKYLNATIEYLIATCIQHRHRIAVYKTLLECLDRLLKLYGKLVNVPWTAFEKYFKDIPTDASFYLQILHRVLKHKIHIPKLLPTLLATFDAKHWRTTPRLAEVFGMAINACPGRENDGFLDQFRCLLDKIRGLNVGDYIQVLYSAQKCCNAACDEKHFKIVSDLAPKIYQPKCLSILSSHLTHHPVGSQLITDMLDTVSVCELVTNEPSPVAIISDLAPKIYQPKCLSILSSHLTHHSLDHQLITDMLDTVSVCELVTNEPSPAALALLGGALRCMDTLSKRRALMLAATCCQHAQDGVRKAATAVLDKAFEELFSSEDGPPAKRVKTDQSQLLLIAERNDPVVACVVESASRGALRGESHALRTRLDSHITTRFAECFYMMIYVPAVSNTTCDLSECPSVLLDLLFDTKHGQEDTVSPDARSSKVVTKASTYQGKTVSLSSLSRRIGPNVTDAVNMDIDDKMTHIDILNALLEFSRLNPVACKTLCVEVAKGLKADGRGFDLGPVISKHLEHMLMKNPNNLTPLALEISRVFIDSVSNISGFKESVKSLKEYTKGSEGIGITTLLYEEVTLRCSGPEMFELGKCKEETYDIELSDEEFSVEALISCFGKLSNWDDLRMQVRTRVQTRLPALWTTADHFKHKLQQYFNGLDRTKDMSWFDKMAACVCDGGKRDGMLWLRETEHWPRRAFDVSAVTEAVSWPREASFVPREACLVPRAACLAQWAARLMIRSTHLMQAGCSEESQTSAIGSECRAQELAWCAAANERRLPGIALQCIQRNKDGLCDNEILAWMQQRVLALRTTAVTQNDDDVLTSALNTAEKYTPMFSEYSSPDIIVGMEKLILQLSHDLKSLPRSKLDGVMRKVATCNSEYEGWMVSRNNAQVLKSFYDRAIVYYDELCASDAEDSDVIISNMADAIGHQIEYNLTNNYDVLFAVILNRLELLDAVLSDATAKNLLNKLQRTIDKLDWFTVEHVQKVLGSFPGGVVSQLSCVSERAERACRLQLQLVADAAYTLWNCVEVLHKAVKANDAVTWKSTFDTMKSKIFENPYAGTDYKLLTKYKNKLYAIEEYSNAAQISRTLADIKSELSGKPARPAVRLSQLCPALRCRDSVAAHERALRRLLAIPNTVSIVKFHDEVCVFTDSVRRPCVLVVRLSDGSSVRRLRKSGECLRADAALQRAAAQLPHYCARAAFKGYSVTPLSEDCGLIEYLEDHERLLTLMQTVHNLDEGVSRAADAQLILSPAQALHSYKQICNYIPSYILRSAIEQHSACVEDFIAKKRNFLNTLSSMAIINWIFGVGDRHLANIMYGLQDGGACGVDWNTVLQYGTGELPPARLTRNLLAVTDAAVLESRLQDLLLCIRKASKMYLPFIKQSFKWMGQEFHDKFNYIKETLEGKTLSYLVTQDALRKSRKPDKDKYIQLLDNVFEYQQHKHTYSVEEQISCFLQHCTDQRILSVTRRGWQPWV